MPAHRTTSRLAAIAAAALALLGATTSAHAAPKAAAPTLTIESRNCAIGPTEEERSVTVTALALLGNTGERVTMRFTLQARQGKTKWRSLLFKDPTTTKKWETTEAAGAGLKLTKTIPDLPEGYQYRVVVESRAIDGAGKVVTKTAKRSVACNQPLFTPTLTLGKLQAYKKAPADAPAIDGPVLALPVKNLGRLASKEAVITVARADTREVLAQYNVPPLKGGETVRVYAPQPASCTQLYVTVQERGADETTLTPAQTGVVGCVGAAAAAASRR